MVAWLRPAVPRPYRQWTVEECAHYAALRDFELLQLLSRDKRVLVTARRLGVAGKQPHAWVPADTAGAQGAAPPRSTAAVSVAASDGGPCHRSPGAARNARRQVTDPGNDPESHPHQAAAAAAGVRAASTATPPQSTAATAVAANQSRRQSPGAARNALRPAAARLRAKPESHPQPTAIIAVGSQAATKADEGARPAKGGPSASRRRSAARSAQHHRRLERLRILRSRSLALLFITRLRRRVRLRRAVSDLDEMSDASDGGRTVGVGSPAKRGTTDRPSSSSSEDDSDVIAAAPVTSGCTPCYSCAAELPASSMINLMAFLGCGTDDPLWVCLPCARVRHPDLVEFFPRAVRSSDRSHKAPVKRRGRWGFGKR